MNGSLCFWMDESPKKCSEGHKLRKILMKLYKFPQIWKLVFPSPVFPNRIDPKLFTHIAHPIIYNTNLAACKIDTTVQQSHQWDEQQPICKVLLTKIFFKRWRPASSPPPCSCSWLWRRSGRCCLCRSRCRLPSSSSSWKSQIVIC